MRQPRAGALVLADISGYTEFVAGTELEHSREILTELLETTTDYLKRGLSVVKLQGDALLCVGERTGAEVLDCLERTFVAFQRRIRDMTLATTCDCRACTNVPSLTLKFVAHHGTYSRMRVREAEDLVGADVNLACRLLKNHVPSREYILATEPVLARVPAALRAPYVDILERYDDAGAVRGGYRDLAALREAARKQERVRVSPEEATSRVAIEVSATPERVWATISDPAMIREMDQVRSVERRPGARGGFVGTEFHCHHRKAGRPPAVMRVVSAAEPYELTTWRMSEFSTGYATWRIEPVGEGRSRVEVAVLVEEHASALMRILGPFLMRYYWRRTLKILRRMLSGREALAPRSLSR